MNISEIFKQAAANSDVIRQKLLENAEKLHQEKQTALQREKDEAADIFQRRSDELKRQFVAECRNIDDAFGEETDLIPAPDGTVISATEESVRYD